ncbi:hypothetical protein ICE98_03319 [Lactococcus lactis]|nr:hypothetical protein [Lactococcus lactis]
MKNVTDFKYALFESDNLSIEKQNAIMRALELPLQRWFILGASLFMRL